MIFSIVYWSAAEKPTRVARITRVTAGGYDVMLSRIGLKSHTTTSTHYQHRATLAKAQALARQFVQV